MAAVGAFMWANYFDRPFILPPKHAELFREAAWGLSDFVGWEDSEDGGSDMDVGVFDALSQGQKQAAILAVAKGLLDPNEEPPDVTSVLAGTVEAIYRQVDVFLELEVSENDSDSIRRLILAAMHEKNYWKDVNSCRAPGEEPEEPLESRSDDLEEWRMLLEDLRSVVLEDADFDMESHFLDLPPEQAAGLKRMMNIHPDYFTAIIDDPPRGRLAAIQAELLELVRPRNGGS